MKAWDVIGWVYEAEVHSPECYEHRFGGHIIPVDADGNYYEPIPIFVTDADEFIGGGEEFVDGKLVCYCTQEAGSD